MAFTVDFIRQNENTLADRLAGALRQTFQGCNYKVEIGLTFNEPGVQPDFSIKVSDGDNRDRFVPDHVKAFARQQCQEIMPGSDPLMLPRNGLVLK